MNVVSRNRHFDLIPKLLRIYSKEMDKFYPHIYCHVIYKAKKFKTHLNAQQYRDNLENNGIAIWQNSESMKIIDASGIL